MNLYRNANLKEQSGMALVISLVLLVALTLMVTGSMRGSLFQEKMTANQFNQSRALMAAEAGAAEVWSWLLQQQNSGQMNWTDVNWQSSLQSAFSAARTVSASKGRFKVEQIDWSNPTKISLTILGEAIDASPEPYAVASTKVDVEFLRPITAGGAIAPAFAAGLISDGDIIINGSPVINGNVHSNNTVNINGNPELGSAGGTHSVTASKTVSAKFKDKNVSKGSVIQSGVAKISIPSAKDFINANKSGSKVIPSCNIPNGDLQGRYYYCEGNITINAPSITNGTIMASGTITSNGGINMGNKKLNLALIAAGDMTFGGSSDSAGLFWTDGNLRQNGSSKLIGSIVARGTITRNGTFNYTQVDQFNENLEDIVEADRSQKMRIVRWVEQR